MFDYHMHSHFSADCQEQMEEMVKSSIDKGLTEICFTEHVDYEYPDPSIIFNVDFPAYNALLQQLQEKYAAQIRIKKGIEIGVQPHILPMYEKLMSEEAFDFVICSMHTTDRKSLHYKEIFEGRTVDEAYQLYYKELLDCVKNYKGFNILGHVDLVKRYSDQPATQLFHDELKAIFDEIIPSGKGIELNTSGVRYGLPHALPSTDVLELYHASGGEIITLGSDAHRTTDIAYDFKASLQLLQSIGFKYITTFTNQQPTFHKIETL